MLLPATEQRHPAAVGLDALPPDRILHHILAQAQASIASIEGTLPQIEAAATLVAQVLHAGKKLIYAGAGSSALMACADGLELPGTYGVNPDQIVLLMAGGLPVDARMPGACEDNAAAATRAAEVIAEGDVVIAVTASGSTPFAVAIAAAAQTKIAHVIGIANTASATIFAHSDICIALTTPPEVIAGSTRMGAGTAQKVALNMISTLAGIKLGQVHDGLMVGVVADNIKLRNRAAGMVAQIAGVADGHAALGAADGHVKPAVLIARGMSQDAATKLLADCHGNLRQALSTTGT
jgi:N-acetylmuramic acid 6-phosphate etherase